MAAMSVTADTFHADRSWLKDCFPLNNDLISVMADTSHDPMGPCGPAKQSPTGDSLMHKPKASLSSVLFWGANVAVAAASKAFGIGTLRVVVHTRARSRRVLYIALNM